MAVKCELFNDNFQNYKRYGIPKAQLVIPYNLGTNAYGSNPEWYVGGDNANGESAKAGKAFFNTDFNFNLCTQNLATVFWTMSTRFGWKEKRLKQLAEALHDTKDMMSNPSRLHHRFSPLDCEAEIKEKFGIDLRAEFKAEVEVKP